MKFLKKMSLILAPIVAFSATTTADNHGDWDVLFDGNSLEKWRGYNQDTIPTAWKIDGDTIAFSAKNGTRGDLITNDEYGNFELQLEWKLSKNGNSGIIFLIHEDPKYKNVYHTGLEMQVLDNEGHPDGKIPTHRVGDLYDLVEAKTGAVKPVGEWNKVVIRLDDAELTYWLNGQKVMETTLWNEAWDKMVASSKFADWPNWGAYRKGHISLQDHDDDVWYRNIKIKRLD